VPVRAPAVLRRERRWVRSAFGGEFNAALVAPVNSAEGRNLVAGMERQAGRSGAVCRSVAQGVWEPSVLHFRAGQGERTPPAPRGVRKMAARQRQVFSGRLKLTLYKRYL
jgi:hypothetical protein